MDFKNIRDMTLRHSKMGLYAETKVHTAKDIQVRFYDECSLPKNKKIMIKPITGKLLDDMGEPLPGAHITNITKNNGVVTDSNGVFVIPHYYANDDYEVSYIGFKTMRVKGKDLAKTIQMKTDTKVLPEVVITPEKSKCPLLCWLKKHKKEVLIGAGVAAVVLIVYKAGKNKETEK